MLTLCTIVKNEESVISMWLYMGLSFASEIVLIDTGSTDRTIPIIKRFQTTHSQIKLYEHPFNGNFASLRNTMIEHCTNFWLLQLDVDEILFPDDINKIIDLIRNNSYVGYELATLNMNPFPGEVKPPDNHIRVFQNIPKIRYDEQHTVHESLYPTFNKLKLPYYDTKIWVKHHNPEGYSRKWTEKTQLYFKLMNIEDNFKYGDEEWFRRFKLFLASKESSNASGLLR